MFCVLLVLFFGIVILPERSESGYCYTYYTVRTKYYKYGSWPWGWGKKTAYRDVTRSRSVCCRGYGGHSCAYPICGGGPTTTSCSRREGYYTYNKTYTNYNSGGTCASPGICTKCNPGYYSSNDPANFNAFCRACKPIDKCDKPSCTRGDYTECDKCNMEPQRENVGRNAYTGLPDITRCQETCSWVYGKRCYPGTCDDNMLFRSCKCSDGFTGVDCATFTNDNQPEIHKQMFELKGISEEYMFLDRSNGETEKVWTNEMGWDKASVTVSASYKPGYSATSLERDYIDSFETAIGIKDLKTSITWERGKMSIKWLSEIACEYNVDCHISKPETSLRSMYPDEFGCLAFQHGDTVLFESTATNGGKVTYINWDEGPRKGMYTLSGVSFTRTIELGFDDEPPYHTSSLLEDPANATTSPLVTSDFSTNKKFNVSWDGWQDDLAGLARYEIDAYLLEYADNVLKRISSSSIRKIVSPDELTTDMNVEENGPYAVEITAFDRAGNYKTARRLLIVDDNSVVDIQGQPSEVMQANSNGWINEPSDVLEIRWTGRFINRHHVSNHWLSAVKGGEYELDDTLEVSKRNTSAIHNINGTVRCEVSRTITLDGNTWDVDFIPVRQDYFDEEKMIIDDEEVTDGKKISFTIRAYDVMDAYNEDSVTVMIDTSPPVIDNLWLTDGDYLNLSIHNVLELNNLVFEFEVYDEHSGMNEVSWILFDNSTNNKKLHGHSYEAPQGETKTLEECNANYSSYARGPNCYCSPYNGCYHKHYLITPRITSTYTGGVFANFIYGQHDGDYYIQVTAINNAKTTTIFSKKITIDNSPPHHGRVHDGLRDQPEVDYQHSYTLSAHWDDFFDKESGVWFYLYAFGTSCLKAEDFDIHNIDGITVHKTYETSAEYIAPSASTYYVTVIAYNHGLDGSKPVCSDGVTVDSTPVDVTEVVVKDGLIKRGLLKDANSGTIYLLTKQREIMEILNPTESQIIKSTNLPESTIDTYPQRRYVNGSKITVNGESYEDDGIPRFSGNPTTLIISDSNLTLSWNASETPSGVHDFEVGLATHASDYPDRRDFTSTHHHQFTTILYPNISDGSLCDILIKATTRSGITSVKAIGPIQIDRTPPVFQGPITVTKEMDGYKVLLVAKWTEDSFVDDIDPNPLSFNIAIVSHERDEDITPFSNLTSGGSCIENQHPTCAAIDVTTFRWSIYGRQTYCIRVKAENTAGLYVLGSSDPFQFASEGVAMDEQDTENQEEYDV